MKYFAGDESPSSSISTVLNTTGRRHSLQPRPPSSPRPSVASVASTTTPSPANSRLSVPGYSSHSRSSSKQSISSSKSVNFVSTQTYQIEKLKHENEELTTKLRKTRLMLNENTSRNRVLFESEILILVKIFWCMQKITHRKIAWALPKTCKVRDAGKRSLFRKYKAYEANTSSLQRFPLYFCTLTLALLRTFIHTIQ